MYRCGGLRGEQALACSAFDDRQHPRVFVFSQTVSHALDLPRKVVVARAQVAEADRVDVDVVQFGKRIHQTEAPCVDAMSASGRRCATSRSGAVEDGTVDPTP